MSKPPLSQLTIVITRPKKQAGPLAERVRQAGGDVILFPVIEIHDPTDTLTLDQRIAQLTNYDLVIFISPTAVMRGMARIGHALPPGLRIAAIGKGSVRALKEHGIDPVIAPTVHYDSEALLDLPEMQQMQDTRVVIFRGEGGRELLADTLRQRGAIVDYAECYRRVRPDASAAEWVQRGLNNEIHGLVVTSAEGLRNLVDMVGETGASWLRAVPVFVTHPNIKQAGIKLGLTNLIVAEGGDDALLQGMIAYLAKPL